MATLRTLGSSNCNYFDSFYFSCPLKFYDSYGPDCGFCRGMADEWEAFAQIVEDEELDIKVASFDVHKTENQAENVRNLFPGPLPGVHL